MATLLLPPDHLAFSRLVCAADGSRVHNRSGICPPRTALKAMNRRWKRLRRLRRALIAACGTENDYYVLLLLTNGASCRDVAATLGVCHTTLWRWMLKLQVQLRENPRLRAAVGL